MGTLERLRAYLGHNRTAITRDLVVAILWVTVLRWTFETQGYSELVYYVVLFGGLLVYAAVVPRWQRARNGEE